MIEFLEHQEGCVVNKKNLCNFFALLLGFSYKVANLTNMIRRGCEETLIGNRECLSTEDYVNAFPSTQETPDSGRACFCNEDLCNANINQENIGKLPSASFLRQFQLVENVV